MNPVHSDIIGIDIGGTKCAVFHATEQGAFSGHVRFPTTTFGETYARLFAEIERLCPGPAPLFGVSCGSPQDPEQGLIQSPPNLPGWDNVPIVTDLTARFGGAAHLMNDANACALAEWHFGAGRGCRSMVFLTHGTGMGGGLILDGRLYEGASGDAGEAGHLRLADDGPEGYGKRGSFEGFCSGAGIARLAALRGLPFGSAREVAEAAAAGHPDARGVIEESADRLGLALAMLIDLLNPERIVLGSIYGRCQTLLEPLMQKRITAEALPRNRAACQIVPAQLGESIGDFGALAAALYRAGRLA